MKKFILALLVLAMVLSMTACSSKEPTLTSVLDYPLASQSLSEGKRFLKNCGYEIESVDDDCIIFNGGIWKGYAYTTSVSLNDNQFGTQDTSFEDFVKSVQAELKAACGEPYSSSTNTTLNMTTEFYSYNDKVIAISIISSPITDINISILPAPSK